MDGWHGPGERDRDMGMPRASARADAPAPALGDPVALEELATLDQDAERFEGIQVDLHLIGLAWDDRHRSRTDSDLRVERPSGTAETATLRPPLVAHW